MTCKVAIIGGAGFIGSRLTASLENSGISPLILDLKSNPAKRNELVYDVRVPDPEPLKGVSGIYLLAAEHADDVRPIGRYYRTNVEGAKNVASMATQLDIRTIVFTSSVAVYGLDAPGASEDSEPNPFNDYGKSKLMAESVLKEWAQSDSSRSLVIVRPTVVFGEENRGNVYNLMRQIAKGRFVRIGKGENKKSMAYVGNIAEFLARAHAFGAGIHLFNYADKPDMPVGQVVDTIAGELGVKLPPFSLPYGAAKACGVGLDLVSRLTGLQFPLSAERVEKYCADTTITAKRIAGMGFERPYPLEDALRRTARYEFVDGHSQSE